MPRKDRRGRERGFLAGLTPCEVRGAMKVLDHFHEMAASAHGRMNAILRINQDDFIRNNVAYYNHAKRYLEWIRIHVRRYVPLTENGSDGEQSDHATE